MHATARPVTLGLAVIVLLSGCAFANDPPAVTIVVTETATAPPPTATATPTPEPVVPPPAPEPAPPAELVPNEAAPEVVEGPAYDGGTADGALGPTTSDGDGNLLTYTVVSGDSFFDIAQRFDLPQQQLLRMNPSVHGIGLDIYIGDIINLDWNTTR